MLTEEVYLMSAKPYCIEEAPSVAFLSCLHLLHGDHNRNPSLDLLHDVLEAMENIQLDNE